MTKHYTVKNELIDLIEITDDLKEITFYYSQGEKRLDSAKIYKLLQPACPQIGGLVHCGNYCKIFELDDLLLMSQTDAEIIDKTCEIKKKYHTIEFILEKALEHKLLTNELYQKILEEVKNVAVHLRNVATTPMPSNIQTSSDVSSKTPVLVNFSTKTRRPHKREVDELTLETSSFLESLELKKKRLHKGKGQIH